MMNGAVSISNGPSSRLRAEAQSRTTDHHPRAVDHPRPEDRPRTVDRPGSSAEDRSRITDQQRAVNQSSGLYVGGGKPIVHNQGSRSSSTTPKNSGEFLGIPHNGSVNRGGGLINTPKNSGEFHMSGGNVNRNFTSKNNSGEFHVVGNNGHGSNSSGSSPRTSGELGQTNRIVVGAGKVNSAHISPKASPDSSSGSSKGGSTPRASFEGTIGGKIKTSSSSPPRSTPSTMGNLCKGNWNSSAVNSSLSATNTNSRTNAKMDYTMGNILNPNYSTQPICTNGSISNPNNQSTSKVTIDSSCDPKSDQGLIKQGLGCSNAEEVKNIGNELYRRGRFAEALTLYERAITLSPGQASYRGNKAAALAGLCQIPEAVYECEEAIKLDPSYVRAHQRAASLYLKLGLVERSLLHFQAARESSDSSSFQQVQQVKRCISKCIEMRKVSNWEVVARESEAAIASGADYAPQVLGYKAEALLKLHKPEQADVILSKAMDVEGTLMKLGIIPPDSFLFMIRAQVYMALGRFDEAVGAAESAFRIDPRKVDTGNLLSKARGVRAGRLLGNRHFQSGKYFEACAAYGEGLESDPFNAVLLCNRAACRFKINQWEKALEDCNAALDVRPNYTKALMRRADCNRKLEHWEDALNDYEALLKEIPGDPDLVRGMMEVQNALKKSQANNDVYSISFGGRGVGGVMEVSTKDQLQYAITLPGVVVVQFVAKWNDQCRQISPFVDGLHKRYPSVNFVKVDVEENPYLAKIERVELVPTFKIYKDGIMAMKEIRGALPQAVEYAVQQHFRL